MNWNNILKKKKQKTNLNEKEPYDFNHKTRKHYIETVKEQEAEKEIKELNGNQSVQE